MYLVFALTSFFIFDPLAGKSHNRFFGVNRRMKLLPERYYRGLTKTQKIKRHAEIRRFGAMSASNPRAYVGFHTDKGIKTRTSQYTRAWRRRFPDAHSLSEKAVATGVPLRYIQECYNRGLAAWRTGHRPGATEQRWGYARVHSLLLCGKTHYGPDADIVRAARTTAGGRKWFAQCKE